MCLLIISVHCFFSQQVSISQIDVPSNAVSIPTGNDDIAILCFATFFEILVRLACQLNVFSEMFSKASVIDRLLF